MLPPRLHGCELDVMVRHDVPTDTILTLAVCPALTIGAYSAIDREFAELAYNVVGSFHSTALEDALEDLRAELVLAGGSAA